MLPPCRPTSKQLVTPAPSLQTNRQTPADQQLVAPVPFLQTDIQTTSCPCTLPAEQQTNPCRSKARCPCSLPVEQLTKQLVAPALSLQTNNYFPLLPPCKPTEQLFVPAPASVAKNKKGVWTGMGVAWLSGRYDKEGVAITPLGTHNFSR